MNGELGLDDMESLYQEFRPNKPRVSRCSDGYCGCYDCERCRPLTAEQDAEEQEE